MYGNRSAVTDRMIRELERIHGPNSHVSTTVQTNPAYVPDPARPGGHGPAHAPQIEVVKSVPFSLEDLGDGRPGPDPGAGPRPGEDLSPWLPPPASGAEPAEPVAGPGSGIGPGPGTGGESTRMEDEGEGDLELEGLGGARSFTVPVTRARSGSGGGSSPPASEPEPSSLTDPFSQSPWRTPTPPPDPGPSPPLPLPAGKNASGTTRAAGPPGPPLPGPGPAGKRVVDTLDYSRFERALEGMESAETGPADSEPVPMCRACYGRTPADLALRLPNGTKTAEFCSDCFASAQVSRPPLRLRLSSPFV